MPLLKEAVFSQCSYHRKTARDQSLKVWLISTILKAFVTDDQRLVYSQKKKLVYSKKKSWNYVDLPPKSWAIFYGLQDQNLWEFTGATQPLRKKNVTWSNRTLEFYYESFDSSMFYACAMLHWEKINDQSGSSVDTFPVGMGISN